jgi:3'(2'), 5'-bisphosphate nucleotidase
MSYYNQKVNIKYKADQSVVSEVDEKSHHLICKGLIELTPHIPIISEECQDHHAIDHKALKDFWLIDPLDGTEGFLKGNNHFTINIAFMQNQRPKYGFIIIPSSGDLYYNDDHNAYWIDAQENQTVIETRNVSIEGYEALMSSRVKQRTLDQLNALKIKSVRKIGSALKFCHIAAGQADIYYRHGTTMEWDTAAGDAILAKAGGSLTNPDGTTFTYCKAGFKNGPFVAHGGKNIVLIPYAE